jgi:hypothetical protein
MHGCHCQEVTPFFRNNVANTRFWEQIRGTLNITPKGSHPSPSQEFHGKICSLTYRSLQWRNQQSRYWANGYMDFVWNLSLYLQVWWVFLHTGDWQIMVPKSNCWIKPATCVYTTRELRIRMSFTFLSDWENIERITVHDVKLHEIQISICW